MNSNASNSEPTLELRFSDLGAALLRYKFRFMALVLLFIAGGVLTAVLMQPIYRATVVIAPAEMMKNADKMSGIGGQLGGLAALAGVSTGDSSKFEESLAVLRSKRFTREFIESNNLIPKLYAGLWNADTNTWTVDEDDEIPSLQDGVQFLDNAIRRVVQDSSTGLVSLYVEWHDPVLAAEWANNMVSMANQHLRDRASSRAEKSIDYLNTELQRTTSIEVRSAIYRLMENQIQNIMYANVMNEYAFSVIDPAFVAEADDYIRPNPPLIIALSFALALVSCLSVAVVVVLRKQSLPE